MITSTTAFHGVLSCTSFQRGAPDCVSGYGNDNRGLDQNRPERPVHQAVLRMPRDSCAGSGGKR